MGVDEMHKSDFDTIFSDIKVSEEGLHRNSASGFGRELRSA